MMMQSYRKAVTAARKDKKPDKRQGLTEEQKQEIRFARSPDVTSSPSPLATPLYIMLQRAACKAFGVCVPQGSVRPLRYRWQRHHRREGAQGRHAVRP